MRHSGMNLEFKEEKRILGNVTIISENLSKLQTCDSSSKEFCRKERWAFWIKTSHKEFDI